MKRLLPFFIAMAVVGCGAPSEDDNGSPAPPPPPKFTGSPDPKLGGVYKQKNADITMTLFPDGKMATKGTVYARGKAIQIDSTGKWAVKAGVFYTESMENGVPMVFSRSYKFEKNELSLTSKMLPNPTVYARTGPAPKQ